MGANHADENRENLARWAQGTPLSELVACASEVRERAFDRVATYSKNFTLDLSHACANACTYCAFRVPSSGPVPASSLLLDDEEVRRRIEVAAAAGCVEALITSGENPGADPRVARLLQRRGYRSFVEFACNVARRCLEAGLLPHTNLGVLTLRELEQLKQFNASMGAMLESTSTALCEPGGPHEQSPGKRPRRRLELLELAGEASVPFTTGLLVGIGETWVDRVETLLAIAGSHERHGHVQEVIVQNFVRHPGTTIRAEPLDLVELVRVVAVARCLLPEDVSVQVAPNLVAGWEGRFLDAGVNDFGGISPVTDDAVNPGHPWPRVEELRRACEERGFELRLRLPVYPRFVEAKGFLSPHVEPVVKRWSRELH
ncbi:MAG: hypothetical protein Kow0069_19340 [Promethearchaeota archaeon]